MLQQFFERAWQDRGWRAWLLAPASVVTWGLTRQVSRPPPPTSHWPKIVVVGNLLAGGTGKTPVLIAIAQELTRRNWRVGVITRGHGVVHRGDAPYLCQGKTQLDALAGGDEAALIAQETGCPVAAHPERTLALTRLCQVHPDLQVVLSDDGLQHRRLARHIELVLIDERGWGNGWLLPAGPLREPKQRLQLADAIIHSGLWEKCDPDLGSRPCFEVSRVPSGWWHPYSRQRLDVVPEEIRQASAEGRLDAWAGISRPGRFRQTLQALGLSVNFRALTDHAPVSEYDLRALSAQALLVTTAKDAVKCAPDPRVWVLQWRASFASSEFLTWLERNLHGPQDD